MPSNDDIVAMLDRIRASGFVMTDEMKKEQAKSFVWGNLHIENPRITRELVDRVVEEAWAAKKGLPSSTD